MKKNRMFYLALPFAALLILSGCKKDDANPAAPTTTGTSSTSQPMPAFSSTADYNGALATIMYEMDAPLPGFPAIQMNAAIASFGVQGGVEAGTVSVNSYNLGKIAAGGKTSYVGPDPSNPTTTLDNIYFNGSNHSWNVSGSSSVTAFSGSVKSVSAFNLISPLSNASVNKATDLSVQWNGGTTSKVLVQLTNITNGNFKVYQEISDNGSYKIPAADLAAVAGNCYLFVVKYNYNIVSGGSKKYVLISEIVKSVKISIN